MTIDPARFVTLRCDPCATLEPFLDGFLFVHDTSGGPLPRLLPGTGVVFYLNLGAPLEVRDAASGEVFRLERGVLICNRHRAYELEATGPTNLLKVNFRPGRLRHFTQLSFAELQDRVLSPEEIWGDPMRQLLDGLAQDGCDVYRQAARLSDFFLRQLRPARNTWLDHVQDRLYLCPNTRIADLAVEAGLSQRHLEREFRQVFGVTPKYFARLARMQRAARSLALNPALHIVDAALQAGFYDQPHFNNELRSLANIAPGELVRCLRLRPSFYNPDALCWYRRRFGLPKIRR